MLIRELHYNKIIIFIITILDGGSFFFLTCLKIFGFLPFLLLFVYEKSNYFVIYMSMSHQFKNLLIN